MPIIEYTPLPELAPLQENNMGAVPSGTPNIAKAPDVTQLRQILSTIGIVTRPGLIESNSYIANTQGWRLTAEGDFFANSGTFQGSLVAGQIHIPDINTTANSFHTDTTGLSWWGATQTNKATAPVRINPTGEMTLGDPTGVHLQLSGPNVRVRSSNYNAGVDGFTVEANLVEAQNLVGRGILRGSTFQNDIISAMAGQIYVGNSDVLASDMTAADNSTLTTRGTTTWAVNDILIIRAVTASGIEEEKLRITDISSAPTYAVTRDLAGDFAANSNPAWVKGTTITKQGSSDGASTYSGGWLRLLGEGTNSPHYSVFSRTGVGVSDYSELVRIGNLNGIGGFSSDVFGIFLGNYSTGKYLSFDNASGDLILNGYVQNTEGTFSGDGSDGAIDGSSNVTISGSNNSVIVLNYTSFAAAQGGGKTFTVTPTGCIVIIKVQGDADFTNWTFEFGGKGYAGGAGGTAVTGSSIPGNNGTTGTNVTINTIPLQTINAGVGGGAGTGSGGPGSSGGSVTPKGVATLSYMLASYTIWAAPGAGGGGGGSGSVGLTAGTSGVGGAGAAGGGCLIKQIGGDVTFSGTTVNCNGNDGSNGNNGSGGTSAPGGGGGGGGGGVYICLHNGAVSGSPTVDVSGGTKGTGATAGDTGGWEGGGGGGGGASIKENGDNGGDATGSAPYKGGNGGDGADGLSLISKNTAFA